MAFFPCVPRNGIPSALPLLWVRTRATEVELSAPVNLSTQKVELQWGADKHRVSYTLALDLVSKLDNTSD